MPSWVSECGLQPDLFTFWQINTDESIKKWAGSRSCVTMWPWIYRQPSQEHFLFKFCWSQWIPREVSATLTLKWCKSNQCFGISLNYDSETETCDCYPTRRGSICACKTPALSCSVGKMEINRMIKDRLHMWCWGRAVFHVATNCSTSRTGPFKPFLKEKKTFQSEIFVSIKYNTTLIWWPKSRWNSEVAEFKGIQRFHTVHLRINHFYLKEQLRNEIPFCSLLFESIPPNLAFSIILVHDPAAKTASLTHEELGDLEEASAANASHLPARWLVTPPDNFVYCVADSHMYSQECWEVRI